MQPNAPILTLNPENALAVRRNAMPMIPLLICDDSNMARKQLLRALPADWGVSVTQASNGREGIEAIRQGLGQVVLLDLTMPEMDGYQALAAIRAENLQAKIIVVSGDVQEEAVRRVFELGALAFLKKPADPVKLRRILEDLDLLGEPAAARAAEPGRSPRRSAFRTPFAKPSTSPWDVQLPCWRGCWVCLCS